MSVNVGQPFERFNNHMVFCNFASLQDLCLNATNIYASKYNFIGNCKFTISHPKSTLTRKKNITEPSTGTGNFPKKQKVIKFKNSIFFYNCYNHTHLNSKVQAANPQLSNACYPNPTFYTTSEWYGCHILKNGRHVIQCGTAGVLQYSFFYRICV